MRYTNKQEIAQELWQEIEAAYSQPERHFHNLAHLSQLFEVLSSYQHMLEDWDTLAFAVFYHDIVYDVVNYVTENTNEDRSADKAEQSLLQISYPSEKISRCKQHILATKKHEQSEDSDTNFLIDADLSILGQPWNVYEVYMKNIRKEYDIYPDPIFRAGRTKALEHFLQLPQLFKTDAFQQGYGAVAKENLNHELEILSFA